MTSFPPFRDISEPREFPISFCTTCKGRAHDIKRTLPKNLADCAEYGPAEFVLLDYNSEDGLEAWVLSNLMPFIESGRLTYAKTNEPAWHSMTHSRNLAFKLARGELVCNVDADNWIGTGFPQVLNRLANEQPARAVFTKGRRLLRGRIGFFKREWEEELGGYDERMEGYGHEDRDLVARAEALGFKMKCFSSHYVTRLTTGSGAKVANMRVKDWKKTEQINKEISANNLERGIFKANQG